jgi:hypothetical protein
VTPAPRAWPVRLFLAYERRRDIRRAVRRLHDAQRAQAQAGHAVPPRWPPGRWEWRKRRTFHREYAATLARWDAALAARDGIEANAMPHKVSTPRASAGEAGTGSRRPVPPRRSPWRVQ